MTKSRYYSIWSETEHWQLHAGQVFVLIYYVTSMDNNTGRLLTGILGNECNYRDVNNLSLAGYDSSTHTAHYDTVEYQNVAQFLNSHIIPALNNLGTQDLLEMYGGVKGFNALINQSNQSHLKFYLSIEEVNDQEFTADLLRQICSSLINLLNESLINNSPFNIDFQ